MELIGLVDPVTDGPHIHNRVAAGLEPETDMRSQTSLLSTLKFEGYLVAKMAKFYCLILRLFGLAQGTRYPHIVPRTITR